MPGLEKPSRQTLDAIPGRVTTFLLAIARYPVIAAILALRGYAAAAHDYAWSRLALLGALPKPDKPGADTAVRDALVELDAWDEPHFQAIRAILEFGAPTVVEELFRDLVATQGPKAAVGVGTLLDRLDAMEAGKPEEVAAIELLAAHAYTKAERLRLRKLVNLTKGFTPAPSVSDEERETILVELYRWHAMWSTIAHNHVTRRDHLIALGIASRRKGAAAEEETGEPEGGADDAKAEPKDAEAPPKDAKSPPDAKPTPPDGATPSPDPR